MFFITEAIAQVDPALNDPMVETTTLLTTTGVVGLIIVVVLVVGFIIYKKR
tara:strand:- start:1016 stop:1168 length:153 start_codon:yes stop_codon:yes gene_type:complete